MPKSGANRRLLEQDPELIKRYIRINGLSASRTVARRYMRVRLKLSRSEKARRKALLAALEECRRQLIVAERSNYIASATVLNVALFVLLAELDFSSMKLDALTHPDRWKRNVSLRLLLLTIYELDLGKVTGRRLHDAFQRAGTDEELRQEVVESLRDMRKAQERVRRLSHEIRNATIAHRDESALRQYKLMSSLDEQEAMQRLASFYDASHRFMNILPKFVMETGNLNGLVRQLLAGGA